MSIAQRLDILVDVPPGGAFPIYAQVEGKKERTGIVLAAPGATMGKLAGLADAVAPPVDLSLEEKPGAPIRLADLAPGKFLPLRLTAPLPFSFCPLTNPVCPNW